MIGQAHLGRMGTVYIPSEQIDPNSYTEGSTENPSPLSNWLHHWMVLQLKELGAYSAVRMVG